MLFVAGVFVCTSAGVFVYSSAITDHVLDSDFQMHQLVRLSRISGMEWWNGIVEWNTGMTFYP